MIAGIAFDRISGTVMVMVALLWMYQLRVRTTRKQRNRP